MTAFSIALTTAAILAGVGLAGPPAAAQSPPAAPASATAPTAQDQRAMARAEKWISDLRNRLRITPAEQPQWEAMAQVMRENALHIDHITAAQGGDPATATALDDMRAYAAITQAHAEDIQKLLPAFEALYDAMSPEQKRTADDVFRQYARQSQMRRPARSSL